MVGSAAIALTISPFGPASLKLPEGGGIVTLTVVVPDFVASNVEVAVMVTDVTEDGPVKFAVSIPVELMLPCVAFQVTVESKLPVP